MQCKHCWKWDHKAEACKNPVICRLCATDHSETDHPPNLCDPCKNYQDANGDRMQEDFVCTHNLRCSNCINANREDTNHAADSRRCPTRLEKYGTVRLNERRTQQANNPWTKVPSRKPRKPKTLTNPTQNTNTSNRFQLLTPESFMPTNTTQPEPSAAEIELFLNSQPTTLSWSE